ncbi:MAG: CinA family protein, partial [Marinobacter sp.]
MLRESTLQQAVNHLGDLLSLRGETVVTAESCTGGWLAKALTDRAGSSVYTLGGLV